MNWLTLFIFFNRLKPSILLKWRQQFYSSHLDSYWWHHLLRPKNPDAKGVIVGNIVSVRITLVSTFLENHYLVSKLDLSEKRNSNKSIITKIDITFKWTINKWIKYQNYRQLLWQRFMVAIGATLVLLILTTIIARKILIADMVKNGGAMVGKFQKNKSYSSITSQWNLFFLFKLWRSLISRNQSS